MMKNILFAWSKANPEISYKQGMNELLGILIFVGYSDMPKSTLNISERASGILNQLNNKNYLEADLYWCFSRLMDLGIRDLFNPVLVHQKAKKKTDLFTWEAERAVNDLVNNDKSNESNVSYILRRSHKIHHQILKTCDLELYLHLEKNKIEPQMYLQRWLRCILSREFSLGDCLLLWDAILGSYSHEPEKELELLDYLCVAMIVYVRSFRKSYLVLQSDHFEILTRLLKFPPVEDLHEIISIALKFKSPKPAVEIKIETQEKRSDDLFVNIEMVIQKVVQLIYE